MKFLLLMFFLLPCFSLAQTIEYQNDSYSIVSVKETKTISFTGYMEPLSSMAIITALQYSGYTTLSLNSTGGLLDESVILGKYIKENDVIVLIKESDICVSACAFAAINSLNLILKGKLFFHRPYQDYSPTDSTIEEINIQFQNFTLGLVKVFASNGYNITLLQMIMNETNKDTFIIFKTTDQLNHFKTTTFYEDFTPNKEWYSIEKR